MAAPTIKIKRSAVSGNAPTTAQLELGELALNTYDGKLFTEIEQGSSGPSIVEIGGNLNTLDVSGAAAFAGAVDIAGATGISGATTFNNDVTFDGATAGRDVVWDRSENQLEFADNAKAVFGSGSDLTIHHSGSHSYISDSGTGNLKLRSNNFRLSNADESKLSAAFIAAGAAELYFNNSKKIETTNSGVTVTGGLIAGGLTYPTSDGSENQSLVTNGSGTLSWSTIAGGTNTYTTRQTTTASQGQTAITVSANYTSGFVDVYLNGIRLISGTDYTETNTSTITLASGATAGDEIETVAWKTLGDVVNIGTVNVIDNLSITGVTTGTGGFVGNLTGNVTGNCSGVAAEATALQNARYFSITGEVTAAVQSFDGTGNTTLSALVADNVIDAANLKVSNNTSASNGQALVKRSGNTGGMTWETISGGSSNLSIDSYENVFGGSDSGGNLSSSSSDNVLLGHDAGKEMTDGYENTCIGFRAGREITTTRRNTCIGAEAGRDFTAGDSTFIGWYSGQNAASNGNTCIGHMTGTEANGNDTAVGYSCGPTGSYSGSTNVCYGFAAGNGLRQSATRNTIIGPGAGRHAGTGQVNIEGSHNIIIGDEASLSSTTVSNECVIGAEIDSQNKHITKFRIPGMRFTLKANSSTPTEGHVLTVDSNGEANFAAASGGGSTDMLEVMLFA
jgi:hypothetical protein